MRRSIPLLLASTLYFVSPALATDFAGRVVGVSEGDTITVLSKGKPVRIRLHGIDCPEKRQGFGKRAKQFTSRLTYVKQVTVRDLGQDRYGRTIAVVMLPDGRALNHELVKAGFAWWYRRYAPEDDTLKQLESEAREAKRGLWADANPVPPWEFRKSRGKTGRSSFGFHWKPFIAPIVAAFMIWYMIRYVQWKARAWQSWGRFVRGRLLSKGKRRRPSGRG